MFDFFNKTRKVCVIGIIVSCAIMLTTFYATDGLLGDKEFSEYTKADWSIAVLPLSIIVASCISALVFTLIVIIPLTKLHPTLVYYLRYIKFSDVDEGTDFLVFDHHELKRACCRNETPNGVWLSVKEFDLKKKEWTTLENGRYIENADELAFILQKDYKYDQLKFFC